MEDYSIWYLPAPGIPYDGYFWKLEKILTEKRLFRPNIVTYVYQDVNDPNHRLWSQTPISDEKKLNQ